MLCNAALMVQISNFYSSFKPDFSKIFCLSFKLFENQTIRLSGVHCSSFVINRDTMHVIQNIKIKKYSVYSYGNE